MEKQQKHLSLVEFSSNKTEDAYFIWRFLLKEQEFADFNKRIQTIADNQGPALITGDSGTGKSTIAEHIHKNSSRAQHPLHRWGCGELDSGLSEATLFGHTAQAFTGARKETTGLIQATHKGTLILDDIDYLPLNEQARLLHFLEHGRFHQLGRPDTQQQADVRIIATTNKDLKRKIQSGEFLPDLLYRIRKWWLPMPRLQDHQKGLSKLSQYLLGQTSPDGFLRQFTQDALEVLQLLKLSGNLRELFDLVEMVNIYHTGESLEINAKQLVGVITEYVYGGRELLGVGDPTDRDKYIVHFLRLTNRNARLTADIVGCSHQTVYKIGYEKGLLVKR